MAEHQPTDAPSPPLEHGAEEPLPQITPTYGKTARILTLVLLLTITATAIYILFDTPFGQRIRSDHHKVGAEFQAWVAAHPVTAPLIFLGAVTLISPTLLPIWWLQILAGYGFGMYLGMAYSLLGAVLGAAVTFLISQTLLAEYVQRKFEARHEKLRQLDQSMGHNGLLVVMAARLTHVLPFGLSNYLFGISRIRLKEVLLGTFLGNIPGIAIYVGTGAKLHPWKNWRFVVVLAIINILLLVPIAIRYLYPQKLRRLGVE